MADTSDVLVRLRLLGGAIFNRDAKQAGRSLEGVGRGGRAAGIGLSDTGRGAARATSALNRTRAATAGVFSGLRTLGTVAVPAVGFGLYEAGKATIEFDAAMRNVNSIAGLNEKQFQSLSRSVSSLGGQVAQQPKTLAEGMYDLVSSGFNASQSLEILRSSAKAATAGLTTTEISTKAVAAVLNAYHLSAKQAANVSDTLFQTVNRGVVTFPELATTIGDVLPYTSQLKVPLKDVGAAISTMTKQGLSGSEATVRLKNAMVTFIKPGTDMAAAISKTGYSSGEALIKAKGFQGALEAVIGTTKGSKQDVAGLFHNIRAIGGALALTGINAKSAHSDLRGFSNVRGLTDRVLAEQSKSLAFQWRKLRAEATGIGIAIGRVIVPPAAKLLGLITNIGKTHLGKDLARIPGAFAAGQQGSGQGYSGIAGRVAAVSRRLPKIATAPAGFKAGISGLSAPETAGFSGVGAVAVKVGRALRGIGQGAAKYGKQFLDAFKPALPFFQNVLVPLAIGIGKGVIGAVISVIPVIKVLARVLGFVGTAAKPLRGAIQGIGLVIGFVLAGPILKFLGGLGKIGIVFRALAVPIDIAGAGVRVFARGAIGLTRVIGALARGFVRVFTFASRFAGTLSGTARTVTVGALNMIGGVIRVVETLPSRVARIAGRVGQRLVSGIANGTRDVLGSLISFFGRVGKAIVNAIISVIKAAPGAVAGAVMSIVPGPAKKLVSKALGIVGLASGGEIRAGGWALVGERGPELARFPGGSTVYDHHQTANARSLAPRSQPTALMPTPIHIYPVIPVEVQVEKQTIHRTVFRAERQLVEAR